MDQSEAEFESQTDHLNAERTRLGQERLIRLKEVGINPDDNFSNLDADRQQRFLAIDKEYQEKLNELYISADPKPLPLPPGWEGYSPIGDDGSYLDVLTIDGLRSWVDYCWVTFYALTHSDLPYGQDALKSDRQTVRDAYRAAIELGFVDAVPRVEELTDATDIENAWHKLRIALESDSRQERAVELVENSTDAPARVSWQEAAERMERLRQQGEQFTSQPKLAEQFGCSSGTINKAIRNTQALHAWARVGAIPKAQSINAVVTDSKPQERELGPEDEAAIREFIETANTETRAWFLALSPSDQIAYLNDPDANPTADDVTTEGKGRLHKRILGRKP